ncbi:MAG: hypothetical protein Q4F72_07520 [Desulfovibrionaceae bacterium]|nr:hypothetical protein [Desulfovibrionaceae bacterium]
MPDTDNESVPAPGGAGGEFTFTAEAGGTQAAASSDASSAADAQARARRPAPGHDDAGSVPHPSPPAAVPADRGAGSADGSGFSSHEGGGRLRRLPGALARLVGRLAGLAPGRRVLQGLARCSPRARLAESRALWRDNLAREDEAARCGFAGLLALWHIEEGDLPRAVRGLRLEALGGVCLFALAVAAMLFSPMPKGLVLPALTVLSLVSIAALGLLVALASLWRAGVLKRRRFVPFTRWLAGMGPDGMRADRMETGRMTESAEDDGRTPPQA